jgi:hypothetical protein
MEVVMAKKKTSSIRVFNFDIESGAVAGIFETTGMPYGPWNVYLSGDNSELTWCWIVDSDDPKSARFPFQGIWLTDGSEIYLLNANTKKSITVQVLFTPAISAESAPTQETESA